MNEPMKVHAQYGISRGGRGGGGYRGSEEGLAGRVGGQIQHGVCGRLGGQGQRSQGVHDQVEPQHLDGGQGRLLDCDSPNAGRTDCHDVDGKLQQQEAWLSVQHLQTVKTDETELGVLASSTGTSGDMGCHHDCVQAGMIHRPTEQRLHNI